MRRKHNKDGALTTAEKKVVKSLLGRGWRNQDIQALVNLNRHVTVNSGRISGVKADMAQRKATATETDLYIEKKKSYDQKTGLNLYDDERLIRAREAMLLAVQVFNSPILMFKTEMFSVLANIAWTYLIHEYVEKNGASTKRNDGQTHSLSYLIKNRNVPISDAMVKNLNALKEIRDAVEHKLMRRSDKRWSSLFQACCLNFDKTMVEMFGEKTSLKNELSFALQFAKLDLDQIRDIQPYDIPQEIDALDARLDAKLSEEEKRDSEYRLKVIFTYDSSSKSEAHVKFVSPSSAEGIEIKNVLIKTRPSAETHPFKPNTVASRVNKKTKTKFENHNHIQAWKYFNVRPRPNNKRPEKTTEEYCYYNPTYKSYSYSQSWVDYLAKQWDDPETRAAISKVK